jgi:hypothetical protein
MSAIRTRPPDMRPNQRTRRDSSNTHFFPTRVSNVPSHVALPPPCGVSRISFPSMLSCAPRAAPQGLRRRAAQSKKISRLERNVRRSQEMRRFSCKRCKCRTQNSTTPHSIRCQSNTRWSATFEPPVSERKHSCPSPAISSSKPPSNESSEFTRCR